MENTTTPHYLTEKGLKPEDFILIGCFSNNTDDMILDDYEIERQKQLKEKVWSSPDASIGNCSHCGKHINHHLVYLHSPTGNHVAVGNTCSDHRMGLSNNGFKAYMESIKVALQHGKTFLAFQEFINSNDGKNYSIATYFREQLRPTLAGQVDKGYETNCNLMDNSFLSDLAYKLDRDGKLSESQVAAGLKTIKRMVEWAEKKATEKANTSPIPSAGKQYVEGVILSFKSVETMYGYTTKILVKADAGWKVYGTLPSKLSECEKGDHIGFTATVTISDDDNTFGFYSRPTKAVKI